MCRCGGSGNKDNRVGVSFATIEEFVDAIKQGRGVGKSDEEIAVHLRGDNVDDVNLYLHKGKLERDSLQGDGSRVVLGTIRGSAITSKTDLFDDMTVKNDGWPEFGKLEQLLGA